MAYPPLRVVHIEEERLRIFIPKQSASRVMTSSRRGIAFKEDSADEMSEEEMEEEDPLGFVTGNTANKVHKRTNLLTLTPAR